MDGTNRACGETLGVVALLAVQNIGHVTNLDIRLHRVARQLGIDQLFMAQSAHQCAGLAPRADARNMGDVPFRFLYAGIGGLLPLRSASCQQSAHKSASREDAAARQNPRRDMPPERNPNSPCATCGSSFVVANSIYLLVALLNVCDSHRAGRSIFFGKRPRMVCRIAWCDCEGCGPAVFMQMPQRRGGSLCVRHQCDTRLCSRSHNPLSPQQAVELADGILETKGVLW